MDLLNLGCGGRYHPDWLNVDLAAADEGIVAHDLQRGLPFTDDRFDAVYHSHLLEHLPKSNARAFLGECRRVLKPGGVLRVAVPDLAVIVDHYVRWRNLAEAGVPDAMANYEWIMLEMYDQCVRDVGGNEMGRYLLQENVPNEAYVRERFGAFFDIIRRRPYRTPVSPGPASALGRARAMCQQTPVGRLIWFPLSFAKRACRRVGILSALRMLRQALLRTRAHFTYKGLDPVAEEHRRIGEYRASGEMHLWMYDRYSLGRLLAECGFRDVQQRSADQSLIPGWSAYCLDTEPDGTVYKPDSLFMEATK